MYQPQLLALAPGEFVFSRYSLAYFFFNIFLFGISSPKKSENFGKKLIVKNRKILMKN